MSDEAKMDEQLTRGVTAKRELTATEEAFAAVSKKYIDAWLASDARDTAGREKLWVATTVLSLVQNQLRQYVADGVVAEKQLEQIRSAGEPKRLIPRPRLPFSL